MIRKFDRFRRLLFFPVGWANSVTRWILGVHSPTGTIKIHNTALPGDKSMSLDVDVEAVAGQVEKRIGNKPFTKDQRSEVCDVIRSHVDKTSIDYGDAGLMVREDWIKEQCGQSGVIPPPSTASLDSGFTGLTADTSKKGGTFTAGNPGGQGVKVQLLCRGVDNGQNGALYWREFTVTSDGRIYFIAEENDVMGVYTDQ